MKTINTHNDKYIKSLMNLAKKRYRDASDILLVEGQHLIQEAKSANLLQSILGVDGGDIIISESVAAKLSLTKSGSKIFGVVSKPVYYLDPGSRFLVLDRVQDPGNIGTLIRSALSFGFDGVIVSSDSADVFSDKTIRSSQGAIFHIPVIQGCLKELIAELKSMNIAIIASHVDRKESTLTNLDKERDLAIVLGSEGSGVSAEVLEMSDETVHIETANFESLNVGVAGSIIAYSLRK